MKGNRRVLGVVLLVIIVSRIVWSQELSARAWVDSTSYLVGDPIRVHVHLTYPSGSTLSALPGDSAGLTVLEPLSLTPEQNSGSTGTVVVASYDSGRFTIPPIAFLATRAGSGSPDTLRTNPLAVEIRLVPVDTSSAIKDLKPPLSIPMSFAEIALRIGIALAIAAMAFGVYRYWRKRKERKGAAVVPVRAQKAAHVIALEELGTLREEKLWQRGYVKEYYSRLTEIVRLYFERRYGFMALEQTTDEILSELRRESTAEPVWNDAGTVLRLADMVKFAKHQPSMGDHEHAMETALSIVNVTRVHEGGTSGNQNTMEKSHALA